MFKTSNSIQKPNCLKKATNIVKSLVFQWSPVELQKLIMNIFENQLIHVTAHQAFIQTSPSVQQNKNRYCVT